MWHLPLVVIFGSFSFVQGQDCILDDIQGTRGRCVPFRTCPFAIEYYKAGVSPKICSGTVVCCPTKPTVAEEMCNEWQSYLLTPINFAQEPPSEPFCTASLDTQGLIVGGRPAKEDEYPHAAALGYNTKDGHRFYCGGTLISEDYLVTAAHCIFSTKGKPTVVLVGDLTLDHQTSNFRKIVSIKEWIVHPEYKPPLRYNDIALIRFNESLEISRYRLPACLPIAGKKHKDVVEAIGWGTVGFGEPQSNNLLAVNLTVFGMKDCDKFYSDAPDKSLRFPQGVIRTQLCAGDKTMSGKDTCNGDSGGPITTNEVYEDKELRCLFRVVGITSFGSRLCGQNSPAVYTKVQSYVPWIEGLVFKK